MPSIPCPFCHRALNLSEGLRGALVQCPACQHTFDAPEEEPRPPPAVPLARPLPPPPDALAPPGFDLGGPGETGLGERHRAALRSAVWWLRAAVAVDFGTSLLGCCTLPVIAGEANTGLAWMFGTLVLEYIPLILVAVATPQLQAKRSYRTSRAAAALVLPPSLWALLQTGLAGKVALDELGQAEGAGFFFLGLAAVTLFGAAAGVTGSVKALALLADPEVKRSFR